MDDSQSAAAPALIGCQGLEPYLLLTKTARGSAAVELIQRVLEAPGVYVFGELLETESVKDLATGDNASYVKLLELFAYGTYSDYKRKTSQDCVHLFSFSLPRTLHTLSLLLPVSVCMCLCYSLMKTICLISHTEQADSLPQLTPVQLKKLKHLTIVSLAAKCRVSLKIAITCFQICTIGWWNRNVTVL